MKAKELIKILRREFFHLINDAQGTNFDHHRAGSLFDVAVHRTKEVIRLGEPGCNKCILNNYPGKVIPAKIDPAGTWRCSNCGRRLS